MAKERSEEKKDKKEKKSTKASDDGVKKSKKDKKDKKSRKSDAADVSMADDTEMGDVTNALSEALEDGKTEVDGDMSVVKTSAEVEINGVNAEQLLAAMVPFANPMADEKSMKKVLKGVKKGRPITFASLFRFLAQHSIARPFIHPFSMSQTDH